MSSSSGGLGWAGIPDFPSFQTDQFISDERKKRLFKLEKYLPSLQQGIVPDLTDREIQELLKDLKEEGNSVFREKDYQNAGHLYSYALVIGKHMQSSFIPIERSYLSTLFSNRAACFIKMDLPKNGVEDCDFAISLNSGNIKAYYRKASALKSERRFEEARKVAEEGRLLAVKQERKQEAVQFEDIIKELDSHLPKTASVLMKSGKGSGVTNGSKRPEGVDEAWLQGTNVMTRQKNVKTPAKNKGSKVKQQKSISKSSSSKTMKPSDARLEESSSSSDDSSSEDEDATGHLPFIPTGKVTTSNPFMVLTEGGGTASKAASNVSKNKTHTKPMTTKQNSNGMGLDDFGMADLAYRQPQLQQPVQHQGPVQPRVPVQHQVPVQPQGPVVTVQQQTDHQNLHTKRAPLREFPEIVSRRPLPYPFGHKYLFTLVCNLCYQRVETTPKEFIQQPNLRHNCSRDILLVKPKSEPGAGWTKVRPRNTAVNFIGSYRLCQQAQSGRDCKVSESICSFAHNGAELDLWNMDRDEQISIQGFINDQKYKLMKELSFFSASLMSETAAARASDHQPLPASVTMATPSASVPVQPVNTSTEQSKLIAFTSDYKLQPVTNTPVHSTPSPAPMPINQQKFPLKDLYMFRLVCEKCLCPTPSLGVFFVRNDKHQCAEHTMVVAQKGQQFWVKVRERKNHRKFVGSYILCLQRCGDPPRHCKFEEDCHYAHNIIEQYLWTLEKEEQFSITDFILQNRSMASKEGFSLNEFFRKHPGSFIYLCHGCFFSRPRRITLRDEKQVDRCCLGVHIWSENKLLVHVDPDNSLNAILPRPFTHPGAFYLLCHNLQFCPRRERASCKFAHSMVERNVWMLERDSVITRDGLIETSIQINGHDQKTNDPQSAPVPQQAAAPLQQPPRARTVSSSSEAEKPLCPHRVMELCGICWRQGKKSPRASNTDKCSGKEGHQWMINRLYLLVPANKIIRALPKRLPSNNRFVMCKNIATRGSCDYARGALCQFAHSSEEIDVWRWMVTNNVMDLHDLARASEEGNQARSKAVKPITRGQPVVESVALPLTTHTKSPFSLDIGSNSLHCQYCSVFCNSTKQWDEHCASAKHMFNVNSDKEHQWNCRQPPWGIMHGNYKLCLHHQEGSCRYSHVPDMYNFCRFAHSTEELEEWKERYEWRQMKKTIALQEGVYSYMEGLLEDYHSSASGISHLAEDITGVDVTCSTPLRLYQQNKHTSQSWIFNIKSLKPLQKVALLLNQDRLHFALVGEQVDRDHTEQIAPGDSFEIHSSGNQRSYSVHIQFNGGIFGSFVQWVTFDFGSRPVLVRKLGVELGTQFEQEKVQGLREKLSFVRWTDENRKIVKVADSEMVSESLLQYKAPASVHDVVTQQSLRANLNQHNYVHKMHNLLYIEELTQARIIASYNLRASLELLKQFQEETLVAAREGELFAKVPLSGQLSDDTNAGKLILSKVTRVLLEPQNMSNGFVYEADIVQKANFDYDGRGRDYIYLCLPKQSCEALGVDAGDSLQVEVQFQMDRFPFARMHQALDSLPSTHVLFPDVTKMRSIRNSPQVQISSAVLNDKQLEIVQHALSADDTYTPPLVVHGSFGTGKTETLAQATMIIMKHKPNSRILIATLSNSAADLYILKHLDAFVTHSCPRAKLLRVYYEQRRVNTVDPTVQKHCLFDTSGKKFCAPSLADIKAASIIVTTIHTSLNLRDIGVREGFFTHIFIDEAGQALECEAIMPLTLATPYTCVILAGDHMQMSPKVYSLEAKSQNLHRSLLERLYRHYEDHETHTQGMAIPRIVLSDNYRTKMEILRFISTIFYGGPNRLTCKSDQGTPESLVPLTFYIAQGEESLGPDSTSYHNRAEIQEVVERVDELYTNWPVIEWGERRAEFIGVVAPYTDQVLEIRKALRRKRRDLGGVVVDRVMNIQGKEFRAVFVSTVRTLHLLDHPPTISPEAAECDGDMGDFGFLSDQKLLNTVFTRAQSLVAVVGEPVTLCAIGECTSIWRTFIKHCSKMSSITPQSVTLEGIRQQVLGLMQSPRGLTLQHIQEQSGTEEPSLQPTVIRETKQSDPQEAGPFLSVTTRGVLENIHCVVTVPDAELLKQIATEVDSGKQDRSCAVQVVKVKGYAVAHATGCDDAIMRSMLSHGDSYTEEESVDISVDMLEGLIEKEPDTYHKCLLHRDGQRAWGQLSDNSCTELGLWDSCVGQEGDVVCVESSEMSRDSSRGNSHVVGVIEAATWPQGKLLLCSLDAETPGLLTPRDTAFRPLLMLTNKQRYEKIRRGSTAVYTFTANNSIKFHHYESSSSSLFIVKYVKFHDGLNKALGLVVGVLPGLDSLDTSLASASLQNNVVEKFLPATVAEVEKLYSASYVLPTELYLKSLDCRERVTFCVKDDTCPPEVQCAYSFDEINQEDGSTSFLIGVHVIDVALFVGEGSAVDREASARGASLSGHVTSPMLPPRLSQELCSLSVGKDKPALSFFISIDTTASVQQLIPKRSIVNVKQFVTLSQVEEILASPNQAPQLLDGHIVYSILMLQRITQIWRKNRLGSEFCFPISDSHAAVRNLLEELHVEVGHQVALLLSNKCPQITPLLTQEMPSALRSWQMKHLESAHASVALTRPYKFPGEVCHCIESCSCLPASSVPSHAVLLASVWNEVKMSADINAKSALILDPKKHPGTCLASHALECLQQLEKYECRSQLTEAQCYNYSRNLRPFVSVTEPASSFMDLTVHRLVLGAIGADSQPIKSKTTSLITGLCSRMTDTMLKHRTFRESVTQSSALSELCKESVITFAVVNYIGEDGFMILLPSINDVQVFISWSWLGLSADVATDSNVCTLNWEKRIYDIKPPAHVVAANAASQFSGSPVDLSPSDHVVHIPGQHWQKVLMKALHSTPDLNEAIASADRHLIISSPTRDVSCEVENMELCELSVCLRMRLQIGHVMKVQVMAYPDLPNGSPTPKVQLLYLTPSLSLFVEHRSNPLRCFVDQALPVKSVSHENVLAYKKDMLALLAAEAATRSALSSSLSFIVHHVDIEWSMSEPQPVQATFSLPVTFCRERQIGISGGAIPHAAKDISTGVGYVCITYPCNNSTKTSEAHKFGGSQRGCWVGHGVLCHVDHDSLKETFHIVLLKSSGVIDQSLQRSSATVEVIVKENNIRLCELSVAQLEGSSDLTQAIITSTQPPPLNTVYRSLLVQVSASVTTALHQVQHRAVLTCLSQPFSVITGPPGCGKTTIIASLVSIFSQVNSNLEQIMVCAPNEQSLDVVTGIIMNLNLFAAGGVVRLYGEQGISRPPKNTRHNQISLHHLVNTKSSVAGQLQLIEERCIEEESVNKKIMEVGGREVLSDARVILTVCGHSVADWLLNKTNIKQLLVDDCNEVTEAECLVPIVHNKPDHVILLGNPKSLAPKPRCQATCKKGLKSTFIDRYSKEAVSMDVQYRMHESIAAFPMLHFHGRYVPRGNEDQNKSSPLKLWPGSRSVPMCFVHVNGSEEEMLPSSGETRKSWLNKEEISHTVRIAVQLIRRFHVLSTSVAILSPYQAQTAAIRTGLQQRGEKTVTVSSISDSQGAEWDYVLLSMVRSSRVPPLRTRLWYAEHLGVAADQPLMQIALTRARKGFIIIGNSDVLGCDSMWSKLLDDYKQQDKVVNAEDFLTK